MDEELEEELLDIQLELVKSAEGGGMKENLEETEAENRAEEDEKGIWTDWK